MCFLFSGGYYTASSKGNISLPALIRCCFIFAYTARKNAASDSRYNAPESFSNTQNNSFRIGFMQGINRGLYPAGIFEEV